MSKKRISYLKAMNHLYYPRNGVSKKKKKNNKMKGVTFLSAFPSRTKSSLDGYSANFCCYCEAKVFYFKFKCFIKII